MVCDAAPKEINLMELRNKLMTPRLDEPPTISRDGSVAHFSGILATPLGRSESFEVNKVSYEIKQENGSWEKLQERTTRTESIMIPQQQQGDCRSRSRSVHVSEAQPLMAYEAVSSSHRDSLTCSVGGEDLHPSSLPPCVPKIVALPVNRPSTIEARMVVEYKGGMKSESNSLSIEVPSLAKPTVVKACLKGGFGCKHKLCVTWTTHPEPSIPNQEFSVKVYTTSSPDVPQYTKQVNMTMSNGRPCERHSCCIALPRYQDEDKYSVIVEAKRSDDVTVPSTCVTAEKGCCFGRWGCIAQLILSLVFIGGFFVFVVLLAFNGTMVSHHCSFNASNTTSNITFEPQSVLNEQKCMIQSCFLCEPDSYRPTFTRFEKEDARQVYCAQFPEQELANSQTNSYQSPGQLGIDQEDKTLYGDTHSLPLGAGSPALGVYLLPNSVFSVFLCLDETTVPSLEVLLFPYSDLTHLAYSQPFKRMPVHKFNQSLCSNTSVTVSEAALVLPALSSPSNVKFKVVKGYLNQHRYNQKVQDQLVNDANLIKSGESIQKEGNAFTKPLCYIQGGQHREVFSGLISIAVPYTWQRWALPTMIVLALLLLTPAIVVAYIFICTRCKQRFCGERPGYDKLAPLTESA